jgi:hypothetical protein
VKWMPQHFAFIQIRQGKKSCRLIIGATGAMLKFTKLHFILLVLIHKYFCIHPHFHLLQFSHSINKKCGWLHYDICTLLFFFKIV